MAPKSKPHDAACLSIVAPCAAILALMTSFDILTNLVNVGYLFGAMMVASSVLIRRYMPTGPEATQSRRAGVLLRFWLVVSFSIGAHSHCIPCFILGSLVVPTDTLSALCSVHWVSMHSNEKCMHFTLKEMCPGDAIGLTTLTVIFCDCSFCSMLPEACQMVCAAGLCGLVDKHCPELLHAA